MWDLLKQCKGELPEREKIFTLAKKLGLSFKKTYQWFWYNKQKVYKDQKLASKIGLIEKVNTDKDLLVTETCLDENQTLKETKTATYSDQDTLVLVTLNTLAEGLNLNFDNLAEEIVSQPSPRGTRKIF